MSLLSSDRVKQGAHWISLLLVIGRGVLAILLGALLLVQPDSARFLATFIGAYWMAAGMISVGAGLRSDEARSLTIILGVIGVLAGVVVQTRLVWNTFVTDVVFGNLLGAVALLTGILHFGGWITVWHERPGKRTRSGYLLGLFEIGLGLVLLAGDVGGPVVRLASIVWALGGGVILIMEGVAIHRKRVAEEAAAAEDGISDPPAA